MDTEDDLEDLETTTELGSKDELLTMLADFDTAMLVGLDSDGSLRARPMGLQKQRLDDCDLWFVSADDTHKTDEVDRHHQVNVCCLRARDRAYISISARARVERSPHEVRRLWQPSWRIWFGNEQPEDGGIVLLKLEIERAEYWEPEGGRLRVLYALARSYLDDTAMEENLNPPKRIG
jgi:general stress protein 26